MDKHEYIDTREYVDVICQFSREGEIIPLRLKVTDEDGEHQAFSIKGYRKIEPGPGDINLGVSRFEVKIQVFNTIRVLKLSFWGKEHKWNIDK